MIHVQRRASNEERAEKVMFVIITDGMENASVEYSYHQINKMIGHQKKNYQWEFIFWGANIDAAEVAGRLGYMEGFSMTRGRRHFRCNPRGCII